MSGRRQDVSEVMPMDWQRTLEAYEQAWAQSEEEKVRAWANECWTANSTYVNPLTDVVRGIDGLARLIMDYPVMFPDADFRSVRDPDVHHEYVRYAWRMSSTCRIRAQGKDYGLVMDGVDIIEFDAEGKIKRVVAFFGAPAAGAYR
jgi:hypothetical protein